MPLIEYCRDYRESTWCECGEPAWMEILCLGHNRHEFLNKNGFIMRQCRTGDPGHEHCGMPVYREPSEAAQRTYSINPGSFTASNTTSATTNWTVTYDGTG